MILTKNIQKGLISLLGLMILLLVSCNNLAEMPEEKKTVVVDEAKTSVLKISLGEKNVRTALPAVAEDGSSFTSFNLYGKNLTQNETDWSQLGEWASLSDMQSASVAITKENWAFKLEAEVGGLKYADDTTNASVNVTEDMTNLSFNLQKLDTLGTLSGGGTLNVTVNYQDADPQNKVERVTVTVQNSNGTAHTAEADLTATDGSAAYTNNSLTAGQYKLIFKFYAKASDASNAAATVLLGSCTERALVTGGLTSSSTITLTSFDAVKSVKYVKDYTVENGDVTINESETVYYSRQSPLITLIANPTKSGKGFDGWYRESNCNENGFSGTAVTASNIASFADNETLYAKWLDGCNLTVGSVTHGSVSVTGSGIVSQTGNVYLVVPNSEVILTFTPTNSCYQLSSFTGATFSGTGNTRTFIMPANDVSISGSSELKFDGTKVSGDIVVSKSSSFKYVSYSTFDKAAYAAEGWNPFGVCVNGSFMINTNEESKTWPNAKSAYPATSLSTNTWKLPTLSELTTIYGARSTLNTSLEKAGTQLRTGNSQFNLYWSSESASSTSGKGINFADGNTYNGNEGFSSGFRVVRALP